MKKKTNNPSIPNTDGYGSVFPAVKKSAANVLSPTYIIDQQFNPMVFGGGATMGQVTYSQTTTSQPASAMPFPKFRVGDRVLVAPNGELSPFQETREAVVEWIELKPMAPLWYLVTFPGWNNGHDGASKRSLGAPDTGKSGYYIPENIMSLLSVSLPEKKILPEKPSGIALSSVIIAKEKLEQIKATISQTDNTKKIFEEWGFADVFEKGTATSLLFHGVPGTGKSLMAQAIADDLKMDLKILGAADIETSEPGGAERNIRKFFEDAQAAYKKHLTGTGKAQLLLLDECDSLLYDRSQIGVILGAQVNALLTELEKYSGVVIFTTNRLGTLDPALERRITLKMEFPVPNQEQREAIWKRMIPKKAPIAKDVNFTELSTIELTGGAIKNCVLSAARMAAYKKMKKITKDCFLDAIEAEVQGTKDFHASKSRKTIQIHGEEDHERAVGGIAKKTDMVKSSTIMEA